MSTAQESPVQPTVSLREITAGSVRQICKLAVSADQRKFVTPNATSIAEAHFSDRAWFRAIYADENPVGFLMLDEDPSKPEYYLWRFMIDANHQGRQFGRHAMNLLFDYVATRPYATELLTSVVLDTNGPQGFYEKFGFKLTGEYEDGEAFMSCKIR